MTKPHRPPPNEANKPTVEDETCAECGGSMDDHPTDDELFAIRVCLINEILCQMDPWDQGSAIALLASEHLGTMVKPGSRKAIREQIILAIDKGTVGVIARMKAEKLPASLEQKMALMAEVSSRLN